MVYGFLTGHLPMERPSLIVSFRVFSETQADLIICICLLYLYLKNCNVFIRQDFFCIFLANIIFCPWIYGHIFYHFPSKAASLSGWSESLLKIWHYICCDLAVVLIRRLLSVVQTLHLWVPLDVLVEYDMVQAIY